MGLTNTTVEALQRGEPGATRERHTFVVERNHAEVIEVDDLQFHPGSSIALPAPIARPKDRENETISALSALAQLLEEHGGRPLWIAGHADDGKSGRFNETLATRRAQNVLALAQGDADAFAASCFSVDCKPLQSLLAWAARVHGLGCDPGPVSGQNNAATRAALLRFRTAHGERFKTSFPPLLAASPEDFRAFFTLYDLSLADLLEIEPEELAGKRGALTFHSPSTSGAGGGFPVPKGPRTQELRSSAGRRVDLVLFDPAVAIPEVGATGEAAYANELRALLRYVAPKRPPGSVCVRLTGMYFEINKCFMLPPAVRGIRKLVSLYEDNPTGELLIVGHTDASGRPSYNMTLSLERARAMAAYLTDDHDAWLEWYGDDKPQLKRWGRGEDMAMLRALPSWPEHRAARDPIKSYQASRGLDDDGIIGPDTRRQLVHDYMALDGTSLPEGITPVVHGCGESFPLQHGKSDLTEEEAAADRRVELYLFPDGIVPPPPAETSEPGTAEYGKWTRRLVDRYDISKALGADLVVVLRAETPYDDSETALTLEGESGRRTIRIDSSKVAEDFIAGTRTWRFEGMPVGKYALRAHHGDVSYTIARDIEIRTDGVTLPPNDASQTSGNNQAQA
jgi:outer membrane protein OmpA-like peptidoglycan-associated protein